MADDIKKVEVAITSTYDGSGAKQAVTDQEALTNSGKGLATALPDLNTKTQEYVVTSEAEYVAIQKAADSLMKKIPVLQAAGKDTASYQTALENLSNALSTERALQIAEAMEAKALAAAKLESATATRTATAATEESNAASALSATSMREILTVIRELEAGRLSRVPGSISILLQQLTGLGPALQAGLITGTAAAFVLMDVVRNIHQEWVKIGEEIQKAAAQAAVPEFIDSIEKQRQAVAGAAADMQGFVDALASAAEKENDLNSQLQQELGLLQAIERARAALTSAEKELSIARIQNAEATGQMTPEKAAEARAAVEKQYIIQAQEDRERTQNEELNARQVALAAAKNRQPQLNQEYQSAQAKAGADKVPEINESANLEQIHNLQTKIDQEQADPFAVFRGFAGPDWGLGALRPAIANDPEVQKAQMDLLEKQIVQHQQSQSPEAAAQRKAEQDAAKEADQRAQDNNKAIADLTKQIADLKEEIAKVRPIEQQTTSTKAATVSEQEGARIAKQFQTDAQVIHEYDKSKNPSPELISKAATAMQEMQDMLIQFKPLLQNIANLPGMISDLKAAIARAKNASDNQF